MQPLDLIKFIDLTTLSGDETAEDVALLCQKAVTPYGPVAAVCLFPQFVKQAFELLPENILVATVVNFPLGADDFEIVLAQTRQALASGAREIDLVFPYERYWAGAAVQVKSFLSDMRALCSGCSLKIILESALWSELQLRELCQVALAASEPDFLKTSTGKKGGGASLEAASIMLDEINLSGKAVGFKASGGIAEIKDALKYAELAQQAFGDLTPNRFRLGASRLLGQILSK